MSSQPTATRPTSPILAIIGYTLRTCVPARRLLLVLPTLGAVLFGLLSRSSNDPSAVHSFTVNSGAGVHGLILPITCLVIGDAVVGAELRSGTFAFTWLTPVRFSTIVVGRWIGGFLISAMLLAPAVALGAIVAGAPSSVWPAVVAILAGSAAYIALFVAIGVTFKRPVVWSLVVILLIERLLGAVLTGIAQITPGWLAQGTLVGLNHVSGLRRIGIPHGWSAVGRLVIVTAVLLALAVRGVRRVKPASASD